MLRLEAWARDGLTDEDIANNIGIGTATLYRWKNDYREIRESLKRGKDVVDIEVENALYKLAIEGNITAIIFWLKNRKPKQWRDKPEADNTNNDLINQNILDLADLINHPRPNRNIEDFESDE